MDLNFLLRCALSLAIASALYQVLRPHGRTRCGLALLVTWAICSGLLAFTAIAIGTILISASLMSDPAWRPAARILLALSIAAVIAYLLLGTAHKHHAPGGLYERIFLGLELLWMAIAAIVIARRNPATQSE